MPSARLLVLASIVLGIGVLISLFMPATQSARESCIKNQLKNQEKCGPAGLQQALETASAAFSPEEHTDKVVRNSHTHKSPSKRKGRPGSKAQFYHDEYALHLDSRSGFKEKAQGEPPNKASSFAVIGRNGSAPTNLNCPQSGIERGETGCSQCGCNSWFLKCYPKKDAAQVDVGVCHIGVWVISFGTVVAFFCLATASVFIRHLLLDIETNLDLPIVKHSSEFGGNVILEPRRVSQPIVVATEIPHRTYVPVVQGGTSTPANPGAGGVS